MTKARELSELGDVVTVSSGNVGIGTSSPASDLHIENATSAGLRLIGSTTGANTIYLGDTASGSAGYIQYNNNADYMRFAANGAERMRIDSSGNLLVGTTSTTPAVSNDSDGIALQANGTVQFSANATTTAIINRKATDGAILQFRKDGTTVGDIRTGGNNIELNSQTGDGQLKRGGTTCMLWATTSLYPGSDNSIDLGLNIRRYDDIYATNGTIQTSDANEKQQIASLTDAEMQAAKAISALFKTFKWNDSVAEKGDDARIHTGVIAQDVEQAMTDVGLNAGDYAFFVSTTWWETQTDVPAVDADEENGVEAQEAYTRTDTYSTSDEAPEGATERNRKGIRYPQLLSFIGAATEQRLSAIESRLDALESA